MIAIRLTISLLVTSLVSITAWAQTPPAANRVPDHVRVLRDIGYVEGGHEKQKLDLYLPRNAAENVRLPLVVWIHGGGWQNGSRSPSPAVFLVDQGFAVASISYRLSGDAKFPAQIHDCKAAIRYLRQHAKEYQIDSDHIGAWGSSAGGHLVALLGTSGDVSELEGQIGTTGFSSRIQAVCDYFGPTDLLKMAEQSGSNSRIDHNATDSPESRLVGGKLQENQSLANMASPIRYVSKDDPPFLIVHGDADPLVPLPQSRMLDDALDALKIPSELIVIPNGGHGPFRQPQQLAQVAAFFQSTLKPTPKPSPKTEAEADYSAELPRIAPMSVAEAQKSFQVQPGFRIELVASEPLVKDPVAFAFNANGELFVVEMCDYSEQATEHLGSIARLIDTDHDGRMDQRTTYAEKLSWPTAIWPWKDGVIVAEPPQLIWLRDTNGNGVSDVREVWYDGFLRSNVQGLVNSLRWTVEGTIQGATSSSGADLRRGSAPSDAKIEVALRGRDFDLDPLDQRLTPASGGGQHGMCFNRWGDKFATSNSDHLQQIINLDSWLASHKPSVPIPSLRRSIAIDGPQAEVYRASPVEPWRIVRTRLRMSGSVPGVVEGGGRAAGYFTGATGTWVMDSEAGFGDKGFDTALVCDVGSNLVHRKRLTSKGLYWSGERIDKESELVRSSDIWFRPVQLGDGPDGALYIADMYREVIEHPLSLPPVIKRHLDLTSGNDRGRIWRVVPTNATIVTTPQATIMPGKLSSTELAKLLHHPVAWQRRTASQLLVERLDASAAPVLEEAAISGAIPEGRLLALHALNRLGKLTDAILKQALADKHPRVVAHAVRLAGRNSRADSFADALERVSLTATEAPVQLALAMTAESLSSTQKTRLLQKLMTLAKEPLVRAAIIVSAGNEAPALFASVNGQSAVSDEWLGLVLPGWSQSLRDKSANNNKQFNSAVAKLLERELTSGGATQTIWTRALCKLPNRSAADALLTLLDDKSRKSFLVDFVGKQFTDALIAFEKSPDAKVQSEALKWLRLMPPAELEKLATSSIEPTIPEVLQLALADSLLWNDPEKALRILLPKLKSFTPGLKAQVLTQVLGYSQALGPVADAIERKEISRAEIAPDVRQQLFAVPNKQQAERFKLLLNTASSDRAEVIERYRPALAKISDLTADGKAAGGMMFQKVCAQCHRLKDVGNDVGPPLKQLGDKSPDQLLEIILDPNREVDPKYLSYSVLLNDGRVMAGIIREESAGQIVLAEAGGKLHTISRSEIDQLKTTGQSLMPIGLEEQITPEQLAQLIAYLKS